MDDLLRLTHENSTSADPSSGSGMRYAGSLDSLTSGNSAPYGVSSPAGMRRNGASMDSLSSFNSRYVPLCHENNKLSE